MSTKEDSSRSNFTSFDKLGGSDTWNDYKYQTEAYAYSHKASAVLQHGTPDQQLEDADSGITAEDEVESTAEIELYKKKSDLMFTYFTRTVDTINGPLYKSLPMGAAYKIWISLSNHFESKSKAAIKQNLRNFVSMKQTEGKTMSSFIDEIRRGQSLLEAAVAASGLSLMEILAMTILLDGVKSRYEAIVENLMLDDNIDFEFCSAKLMEKSERLKIEDMASRGGGSSSRALTMAVAGDPPSCSHCGKRHESNKCWQKFPHLRKVLDPPKTLPGKPRQDKAAQAQHRRDRSKVDIKYVDTSDAWAIKVVALISEEDFTADDEDSPLMIAATEETSGQITFAVDSAAEACFANSKKFLQNFDHQNVIKAICANGQSSLVQGAGQVISDQLTLPRVYHNPNFPNLLAVCDIVDQHKSVVFDCDGVRVVNTTNVKIDPSLVTLQGPRVGGGFKITMETKLATPPSTSTSTAYSAGAKVFKRVCSIKTITVEDRAKLEHLKLGCPCPARHYEGRNHWTGSDVPLSVQSVAFWTRICDQCPVCKVTKSTKRSSRRQHDKVAVATKSSTSSPPPSSPSKTMTKDKGRQAKSNARTGQPLQPFERVAVDIVGPFSTLSYGKAKFLAVLRDLGSKSIRAFPLKHKGDLATRLQTFFATDVTSQGFTCREIKFDPAGEQTGHEMRRNLTALGIKPLYTDVNTSSQNGQVERANRTIQNMVRTLRIGAGFPRATWAELAATASMLEWYLPSSVNPGMQSGYEMVYGAKPDISFLHRIGTTAYVHINKPQLDRLDETAKPGKLIGYSGTERKYRVLMDNSTGEIRESSHVTFHDTLTAGRHLATTGSYGPVDLQWNDLHSDSDDDEAELDESNLPAPLLPPRIVPPSPINVIAQPGAPVPVDDMYLIEELHLQPIPLIPDDDGLRLLAATQSVQVVKVYKVLTSEALKDPAVAIGMRAEIDDIIGTGKATIVTRPPFGTPVIGSTWAGRRKPATSTAPARIKMRIAPWGFQQQDGVNYNKDKISSATPMLQTIMMVLAISCQRNMHDSQLDVTGAFSLCNLEEDIYVEMPAGFRSPPGKDMVLKLNNALNGLKQAGYNWREVSFKFLVDNGFTCDGVDPCLFFKWNEALTELCMVLVWTDDFKIFADLRADVDTFIVAMQKAFPCRVCDTTTFVGLQVRHDRDKGIMGISMGPKIAELLESTGLTDCKPVSTPAVSNTKLQRPPSGERYFDADGFDYPSVAMSVLWIARACRFDGLYAVNQLTPHLTNYDNTHIQAAKHLLRYLKGTKDMELIFRRDSMRGKFYEVKTFSDADFAGEPQENEHPMRSLTGTCISLNGTNFIYAQSKLQSTLARSTQEAEYRAGGHSAEATLTVRNQLQAMQLLAPQPSELGIDNQATIQLTKNVLCQAKTRHIKLDHHFIREVQAAGEITVVYCPTKENVADILTKALPKPQFLYLRSKLMGHET